LRGPLHMAIFWVMVSLLDREIGGFPPPNPRGIFGSV